MTRFPLTAIGACAVIIAAHALPIRASAEKTATSKDGTYPKYEAYASEYPKYEVWTSDPYGP